LIKRINEIVETRERRGYRRIQVLLKREGWLVNAKRVCRLYREIGLQLRNKSPKAQLREDRSAPTAANQVRAMDFVHDQLFDGRKIRVLTIVDTFTRLSPAIDVRQHFRGGDVAAEPLVPYPRRGAPRMRGLARRLQRGAPAQRDWQSRACDVSSDGR
jgi:putative transposase